MKSLNDVMHIIDQEGDWMQVELLDFGPQSLG